MSIIETRESLGLCGHVVEVTITTAPDGREVLHEPDLCPHCQADVDALPPHLVRFEKRMREHFGYPAHERIEVERGS